MFGNLFRGKAKGSPQETWCEVSAVLVPLRRYNMHVVVLDTHFLGYPRPLVVERGTLT